MQISKAGTVLAALLWGATANAQVLQATSCAIPGGTNATVTSTVDTDVEATFSNYSDPCNFLDTTPLNTAQCTTPTAFTIEWQFSTAAVASNGTLQIFAAPEDGDCATYVPSSSADYFYNGLVTGVPSAVTQFPGGAGNNGETLATQNGLTLDTKAIMQAGGCCNAGADTSTACDGVVFDLCVVVQDDQLTPAGYYSASMQFYVDTVPPPLVTDVVVTSGDGRLTVTWTGETAAVEYYNVKIYNPDGSLNQKYIQSATVATNTTINHGLSNGVTYTVTLSATDYAGNVSAETTPIAFTPQAQCDAWECYSGKEKGGFCFISTAAYGSYDDKVVQIFRDFRDRVLLKSAFGRALVLTYYKNGVAPAVWLAQHTWARRVVAALLFPIGIAAAFVVRAGPASAALICLALLALFGWLRRYAKAALLLVVFLLPLHAHAQSDPEPPYDPFEGRNPAMAMDHDFDEQGPAPDPETPSRPRVNLAAKIGTYRPNIDSDPATNGWYKYYFGPSDPVVTGAGRKPLYFLEGDIYLWRTLGLLGISGGIGYWQASAHSRICTDSSNAPTPCTAATLHTSSPGSDVTDFRVVPLTLSVVYRFDYFLDRFRVPLIPYLRAGLDCDIWWIDGSGRQAVKPEWMGKKNVQGIGATFGVHARPGLAIDLGWADFLHILNSFHAAVTFEWTLEKIDNFGSKTSWDMSDSSFLAGLEITI